MPKREDTATHTPGGGGEKSCGWENRDVFLSPPRPPKLSVLPHGCREKYKMLQRAEWVPGTRKVLISEEVMMEEGDSWKALIEQVVDCPFSKFQDSCCKFCNLPLLIQD